jgi:hypothetical protein
MSELVKGASQLQNYLKSVDEDIKNLQSTFNHNMTAIGEGMQEILEKLDKIERRLEK